MHIPRRRAFDLQGESAEAQIGADQRNWRQASALGLVLKSLRRAIDQNAVPINLQIGRDANLPRARRQLAGEIGSHSARAPSGKSHVIDHAHPLAVRVVFISHRFIPDQRFHTRRDRLHTGLRRRVHAVRRKVFDLAMQQQPQWAAAVRLAQIEDQAVRLGKALELRQREIAEVAMRQQIGQHIVAVLVPRSRGRMRVFALAHHHLELRIRRVRGEILVGINFEIRGMIDRHHAHLIEVNGFLQRLHEAEAEVAVFFANGVAIDLDVFDRPRDVALPRPNPVSDHARAQHVGNQFVALAIPNKQRWTRTAAAVDLEKILLPVARNIDFVLQHARRPQHAHDVSFFRVAEPDHDVGRILPQVSGRTGDLKLLPVSAREHFNLRPDGALVVSQSLKREPQPVVLIAAFIA